LGDYWGWAGLKSGGVKEYKTKKQIFSLTVSHRVSHGCSEGKESFGGVTLRGRSTSASTAGMFEGYGTLGKGGRDITVLKNKHGKQDLTHLKVNKYGDTKMERVQVSRLM